MSLEVSPHLSLLMLLLLKAWRRYLRAGLTAQREAVSLTGVGGLLLLGPEQLFATSTNPIPAQGVQQQGSCAGRGHLAQQTHLVPLGFTLSSLIHLPHRDPKNSISPSSEQSGLQEPEQCNSGNPGCTFHARNPKH